MLLGASLQGALRSQAEAAADDCAPDLEQALIEAHVACDQLASKCFTLSNLASSQRQVNPKKSIIRSQFLTWESKHRKLTLWNESLPKPCP
jgi:hypothetical protein